MLTFCSRRYLYIVCYLKFFPRKHICVLTLLFIYAIIYRYQYGFTYIYFILYFGIIQYYNTQNYVVAPIVEDLVIMSFTSSCMLAPV